MPTLKNRKTHYDSVNRPAAKEGFDKEVSKWVDKGWLVKATPGWGGVLPFMAVIQLNNSKVRLVLDFRELNDHVMCGPGYEAAACDEAIRR